MRSRHRPGVLRFLQQEHEQQRAGDRESDPAEAVLEAEHEGLGVDLRGEQALADELGLEGLRTHAARELAELRLDERVIGGDRL